MQVRLKLLSQKDRRMSFRHHHVQGKHSILNNFRWETFHTWIFKDRS